MRLSFALTLGVATFAVLNTTATLHAADAAGFPTTLDEAEQVSKATGRPLLIVAGSET